MQADGSHLQAMWQRVWEKDPDAPPALLQRELQSACSSGGAYQASYQAVARQDFAGQLRGLACPVLVYAGDADPLHGAVAPTLELLARGERAAQSLPQALGGFRWPIDPSPDDTPPLCFNVNTTADLERARTWLGLSALSV